MDKEKNKGGRPPKYATEEALVEKIVGYFLQCEEKKEMPNKAGLCAYCGFGKDTYQAYAKNPRFVAAIKRFEFVTENAWVQRLGGNSPTGAIFYLKNAFREDYKDRYDTDVTSGGKPIRLYEIPNRGTPKPQAGAGADTD